MSLEGFLEVFPKELVLKDGLVVRLRPLEEGDEAAYHAFFLAVPERERMVMKHRVTDREVIRDWCRGLDFGRHLPLLAFAGDAVLAAATLHQQLGGWKRQIGRISVLVHPEYRGRGLARALVTEAVEIARGVGLSRIEAEFVGEQEAAMKVFSMVGFRPLVRWEDYVEDMQGVAHDYILMGLDLRTDEEFAGMG